MHPLRVLAACVVTLASIAAACGPQAAGVPKAGPTPGASSMAIVGAPNGAETPLPTATANLEPGVGAIVERRLLADVASVDAVAEDGSLLVRLTSSPRDLHILDPRTGSTTLVARPPSDDSTKNPALRAVGLSATWVSWISRESVHGENPENRSSWYLMARDCRTGQEVVVAQEDAAIPEELSDLNVFPSAALNGNRIAWAYSEMDSAGGVSNVIKMMELPDGPTETIARLAATIDLRNGFMSDPALSGDAVVWCQASSRASRPFFFEDVYLYDLASRTTTRLNASASANSPAVSKDYVIWVEHLSEPSETRTDIVLYDRRGRTTTRLNPPDDERRVEAENWNPHLGSRFVTWWRGRADGFYLYDLRQNRLEHVPDGFQPILNGSFLVWTRHLPGERRTSGSPPLHWWARLAE